MFFFKKNLTFIYMYLTTFWGPRIGAYCAASYSNVNFKSTPCLSCTQLKITYFSEENSSNIS